MDVYIYSLNLNDESPCVKKACGLIDTDDQFDGDPVLIIPGPFEGEEDV